MSELKIPESWASSGLHELCEFIRNGYSLKQNKTGTGSPVSRIETIATGEIDFNRIGFGDIANDRKEQYRLKKGDILFSHINSLEHIGKTALFESERELYHGMNLLCMRPKSQIQPKYLTYFLKFGSTRDYFRSKCKRAINQVSINTKEVGALDVPIPPFGEQKRIVAKIESTQEKVKTIESSISKAEELIEKYRESLLQKAFRGELVPQDHTDELASKLIERIRAEKAKQSDGKKKKKDELPPIKPEEIPFEIPKSWEWIRLGEVCTFEQGLQVDTSDQQTTRSRNQVPFWRIINFTQNDADIRYIDDPGEDYHISENDIVMVRYGATAGFSAEGRAGVLANNLFTIRSEVVEAQYLLHFFKSKFYQNELARFVRGGAMPAINFEFMRSLLIPLPSKKEQISIATKITSELNRCGRQKEQFGEVLLKLNGLLESILNSAFSGRLVPQISIEGSGHELLESLRIVQGKEAPQVKSAPKKRGKR